MTEVEEEGKGWLVYMNWSIGTFFFLSCCKSNKATKRQGNQNKPMILYDPLFCSEIS